MGETVESELTQYSASMMLNYWKSKQARYLTIATSRYYLDCPAQSAPVECLSSIAGKLLRPGRIRLSEDTFELNVTVIVIVIGLCDCTDLCRM